MPPGTPPAGSPPSPVDEPPEALDPPAAAPEPPEFLPPDVAVPAPPVATLVPAPPVLSPAWNSAPAQPDANPKLTPVSKSKLRIQRESGAFIRRPALA